MTINDPANEVPELRLPSPFALTARPGKGNGDVRDTAICRWFTDYGVNPNEVLKDSIRIEKTGEGYLLKWGTIRRLTEDEGLGLARAILTDRPYLVQRGAQA